MNRRLNYYLGNKSVKGKTGSTFHVDPNRITSTDFIEIYGLQGKIDDYELSPNQLMEDMSLMWLNTAIGEDFGYLSLADVSDNRAEILPLFVNMYQDPNIIKEFRDGTRKFLDKIRRIDEELARPYGRNNWYNLTQSISINGVYVLSFLKEAYALATESFQQTSE